MRRPPLVDRATGPASATEEGTSDALGELLHVLAAGRGVCRAASIEGDAAAIAWIASALPPGTPFFVADATDLGGVFADDPDVRLLGADWADGLAPEAPFDLIHVAGAAQGAVSAVLALAAPRATLVVPQPVDLRPEAPDAEAWLGHPRLDATVVAVAGTAAIVAVVRG